MGGAVAGKERECLRRDLRDLLEPDWGAGRPRWFGRHPANGLSLLVRRRDYLPGAYIQFLRRAGGWTSGRSAA